jgi:predicted helicase
MLKWPVAGFGYTFTLSAPSGKSTVIPRIPFYDDFAQWSAWGKALMELHLNYESAEPYPLGHSLHDMPPPDGLINTYAKAKLKADKAAGEIVLDSYTTITGIPPEAWEYKLGNRSALEWILDQYKEGTPKDPTIAAQFHTYRFADYKDQVADLPSRVCTVSVETMKLIA